MASACNNETTETNISEYKHLITKENLVLEKKYEEMLKPILSLKSEDPKTYWFIVSWLNTNYRTPNWKNYNSEEWKTKTKERGIDCSGFARVMQEEIFNRKIRGGSRGIYKNYCKPIGLDDLKKGDLLFFKAPYSKSQRIVHVGVYLMDSYFVHATSTKSASKGLGLMINSLQEENWSNEFAAAGSIKTK